MRSVTKGLIAGLLLCSAAFASAATPVIASGTIGWVAPTTDTNGNLLTGSNALTSYSVYLSTSPLTSVPTAATATATASAVSIAGTMSANVGDTIYAYVTACNANGCSGLSMAGTKVVPPLPSSAPGVPTTVTITIAVSPPVH